MAGAAGHYNSSPLPALAKGRRSTSKHSHAHRSLRRGWSAGCGCVPRLRLPGLCENTHRELSQSQAGQRK